MVENSGTRKSVWYLHFGVHALLIAVLAVVFYWNTTENEYALDDTVVIVRNEFVHRGVSGIPDILSKDAYYSYYDQLHSTNYLSGGRYRPLSIVSFAIEQQFFGVVPEGATDSLLAYGLGYRAEYPYEQRFIREMHTRHLFNVVWYALAVVALLYFLRYVVFRGNPVLALLAAVLFTIHPIHTEVVANVKSRDEIMSLLFICLTFIFAAHYRGQGGRKRWLAAGLLSYFLALLSKEYAITLVALLPLSFYLFSKDTIKGALFGSFPYFGVAALYVLMRWSAIGTGGGIPITDIQINPYAYATSVEKVATEMATSLRYLRLLVFPHPLTSDYSYNQIPYTTFKDPMVWLSVLVHLVIVTGIGYFFRKRSVLCFALAFYILNLLLVNNFIFDIGATMGERLVFHSSVGFCIILAFLANALLEKIKVRQLKLAISTSIIVAVVVLCWFQTTARNCDWNNDTSLFLKDIDASPNSFLINENVGSILVNRSDYEPDDRKRSADLHRATRLLTLVVTMQDNYVQGYLNRGIAYLKLGMPDSMLADIDKVKQLYPIHPQLPFMYYQAAKLYQSQKNYAKAIIPVNTALQLTPGDTALLHLRGELTNRPDAASK